ncbi:MAG: type B 50S ribosomal protein L31 [Chlamydiae bacterium]|nr:type B 50S ribosomal protein L31 [Chlamydiota bacterium]
MKKEGHPAYQDVLFIDSSTDYKFVCGTTLKPKDKATFEGKEYPVMRLPISSASHPFWTKSSQFADSEGRIDKFKKRYQKVAAAQEMKEEENKKRAALKKEEAKKKKK